MHCLYFRLSFLRSGFDSRLAQSGQCSNLKNFQILTNHFFVINWKSFFVAIFSVFFIKFFCILFLRIFRFFVLDEFFVCQNAFLRIVGRIVCINKVDVVNEFGFINHVCDEVWIVSEIVHNWFKRRTIWRFLTPAPFNEASVHIWHRWVNFWTFLTYIS